MKGGLFFKRAHLHQVLQTGSVNVEAKEGAGVGKGFHGQGGSHASGIAGAAVPGSVIPGGEGRGGSRAGLRSQESQSPTAYKLYCKTHTAYHVPVVR